MYQSTILLTIGCLLALLGVVALLRPRVPAALLVYLSMLTLHASTYIYVRSTYLVFWAVASSLVLLLWYYNPKGEPDGNPWSNLYIGLSALAACVMGIAIDARLMTLFTVIGGLLGQWFYSRTPRGRWQKFPQPAFFQYFCVKTLPALIATAMLGVVIVGAIS